MDCNAQELYTIRNKINLCTETKMGYGNGL